MCGILLIFSKKDFLNRKHCSNATKKIKSRGPDKLLKKFYYNDKLYIANSILSITGKLKSKNDSLISSQTKNFDIAFNGQIFNFGPKTEAEISAFNKFFSKTSAVSEYNGSRTTVPVKSWN